MAKSSINEQQLLPSNELFILCMACVNSENILNTAECIKVLTRDNGVKIDNIVDNNQLMLYGSLEQLQRAQAQLLNLQSWSNQTPNKIKSHNHKKPSSDCSRKIASKTSTPRQSVSTTDVNDKLLSSGQPKSHRLSFADNPSSSSDILPSANMISNNLESDQALPRIDIVNLKLASNGKCKKNKTKHQNHKSQPQEAAATSNPQNKSRSSKNIPRKSDSPHLDVRINLKEWLQREQPEALAAPEKYRGSGRHKLKKHTVKQSTVDECDDYEDELYESRGINIEPKRSFLVLRLGLNGNSAANHNTLAPIRSRNIHERNSGVSYAGDDFDISSTSSYRRIMGRNGSRTPDWKYDRMSGTLQNEEMSKTTTSKEPAWLTSYGRKSLVKETNRNSATIDQSYNDEARKSRISLLRNRERNADVNKLGSISFIEGSEGSSFKTSTSRNGSCSLLPGRKSNVTDFDHQKGNFSKSIVRPRMPSNSNNSSIYGNQCYGDDNRNRDETFIVDDTRDNDEIYEKLAARTVAARASGSSIDLGKVDSKTSQAFQVDYFVGIYITKVLLAKVRSIRIRYDVTIETMQRVDGDLMSVVVTSRSGNRQKEILAVEAFKKIYEETSRTITVLPVEDRLRSLLLRLQAIMPSADITAELKTIDALYSDTLVLVVDNPRVVELVGKPSTVAKAFDRLRKKLSTISSRSTTQIVAGTEVTGLFKEKTECSSEVELARSACTKDLQKTGSDSALQRDVGECQILSGQYLSNRLTMSTGAAAVRTEYRCMFGGGVALLVCRQDITNIKVDAIVNAANSFLENYSGVARAIEERGGDEFRKACKLFIESHGPLKLGEVTHTPASGQLVCNHVLHVVSPIWSSYNDKEKCVAALQQALYNALLYANERLGARSVAIPAIGTGIFEVPLDVCARSIFWAIKDYAQQITSIGTLRQIYLISDTTGFGDIISVIFDRLFQCESLWPMPSLSAAGNKSNNRKFKICIKKNVENQPSYSRSRQKTSSAAVGLFRCATSTTTKKVLMSSDSESDAPPSTKITRRNTRQTKCQTSSSSQPSSDSSSS